MYFNISSNFLSNSNSVRFVYKYPFWNSKDFGFFYLNVVTLTATNEMQTYPLMLTAN